MKTNATYKIIGAVCLTGILSSLFLPFFQTITDGMQKETYRFVNQYQTMEGFLTTYNGFGSLFAIFNTCWSTLLFALMILFNIRSKPILFLGALFYALSQLFMLLDQLAAPFLLSAPDKLLTGYATLSFFEIALFICLFQLAKPTKES